jgi:CheY-like chemotaxis protein
MRWRRILAANGVQASRNLANRDAVGYARSREMFLLIMESSKPSPMILVIDDKEEVTELVCMFLQRGGYPVISANNGQEGIIVALSQRPRLVLCDSNMPGISGLDVLRAIREHATIRDTLFVLMTGSMERPEGEYEPNAFLQKPFVMADMVALISQMLGGGTEEAES